MEERKDGFEVKDASGFFICGVPHREDLHRTAYQYATNFSPAMRQGGLQRRSPDCRSC
jgi:hypothetical protein